MSTPDPVVLLANQLGLVLRGAHHVPMRWGDRYLRSVADQLTPVELTDGQVEAAVPNAVERMSSSRAHHDHDHRRD
jgi:hypothetical protein